MKIIDRDRPFRLSSEVTFTILALVLFAYFFSASAPSPAFVKLQLDWNFSTDMLTVAFGVYAISLLFSLIFVGSLSDSVGRKPVIFTALVIQATAMILFFVARNIQGLIVARVLQGFATGIASGALSAAVVEAAPESKKKLGALISGVSPLAGLAIGALVSGIALSTVLHPIEIIFGGLAVVFCLGAVLLIWTPESVTARRVGIRDLVPKLSIPSVAFLPFLRGMPALITTWSLGGLYLSLIPVVILEVFAIHSGVVNGFIIFLLSGIGAIAPTYLQRYQNSKAVTLGLASIVVGLLIALIAFEFKFLPLFFVSTVVCGIGFGGAFTATIQSLATLVEKNERARLFTMVFIVCYLALSLPPMIAGFVVKSLGLVSTIEAYITFLLVIAILGIKCNSNYKASSER